MISLLGISFVGITNLGCTLSVSDGSCHVVLSGEGDLHRCSLQEPGEAVHTGIHALRVKFKGGGGGQKS
jgi:hypothetical protein